jgi:hypothetical protein
VFSDAPHQLCVQQITSLVQAKDGSNRRVEEGQGKEKMFHAFE